jgi:hypothetical protein
VSVINAFLSTWSNARQTFGEGSPQTGAQYDNSGALRGLESNLEAATPGSRWTGLASAAYDTANTEHRRVIRQLAGLDQRLAAQVDRSAQVVDAGRRNLDSVRKWVVDAAASAPPGQAGESIKMAIAQKGLTQLQEIIQKSNGDLNAIGGTIRSLDGEYHALGNQKFGIKEGPGFPGLDDNPNSDDKTSDEEEKRKREIDEGNELGASDGDSLADGQLGPAERRRLLDATTLTPEQKAALDNGNLTIPSQRMAYLNGLSHFLDGKSPSEIKAILGKLPPSEAQAVSNAMHLVGTERVRADIVDPSIKMGEHGYVPAVGGKENLPQSIQDVFDAPLKNSPIPEQVIGRDGRPTIEWPDPNKPYKFLDEYRAIAAIANNGDPSLQRGSAINDGLLAESRELLNDFDSDARPNPAMGAPWAHENIDPALQDMLSAASHDPVTVHDAFAGADGNSPNNDFIGDLYKHDWADNGSAAGSLFPDAADASERAGQTMHAFDAYAGSNYQELLNIEGKQSLGQINPALTQALAQANIPYLDDMFNANLNATQGFGSLDGLDAQGGDANMPVTRGLFAVIDSDPTANAQFNGAATDLWKGYIANYSYSLVNGTAPDAGALQAAGYLQRMMDQGEFLHQYDLSGDAADAAKKAMESRAMWYDLAHDTPKIFPYADTVVDAYDAIPGDPLRDFYVGAPPDQQNPALHAKNLNEVMHLAASYAASQRAGDLDSLGQLVVDGQLEPFTGKAESTRLISDYLSDLARGNDMGFVLYTTAYETGLAIPQDELDDLQREGS